MFEQDYIMRLIKEMVRAILKLVFNIDTDSPTKELVEDAKEQLKTALLFYLYLNEKDDDFLKRHDFCREEIKQGLQDLAGRYGVSGVSDVFMMDV